MYKVAVVALSSLATESQAVHLHTAHKLEHQTSLKTNSEQSLQMSQGLASSSGHKSSINEQQTATVDAKAEWGFMKNIINIHTFFDNGSEARAKKNQFKIGLSDSKNDSKSKKDSSKKSSSKKDAQILDD